MGIDSTYHRNQPYRSPHHSRWGDALPKATFLQSWESPTFEAGWYTRSELEEMGVDCKERYFTHPTLEWEGGITAPNPKPTACVPSKNITPRKDDRNLWVHQPATNREFEKAFGAEGVNALLQDRDGLPYDKNLMDKMLIMDVMAMIERQPKGRRSKKR
jgi:hypothetical protein